MRLQEFVPEGGRGQEMLSDYFGCLRANLLQVILEYPWRIFEPPFEHSFLLLRVGFVPPSVDECSPPPIILPTPLSPTLARSPPCSPSLSPFTLLSSHPPSPPLRHPHLNCRLPDMPRCSRMSPLGSSISRYLARRLTSSTGCSSTRLLRASGTGQRKRDSRTSAPIRRRPCRAGRMPRRGRSSPGPRCASGPRRPDRVRC